MFVRINVSKEIMSNEERAEYINHLSVNFSKHCPKTAKQIKHLAEILLKPNRTTDEISTELSEIMSTFWTEYIANDEDSVYREKCLKVFFGLVMEIWAKRGYATLISIFNSTTPEFKKAVHP